MQPVSDNCNVVRDGACACRDRAHRCAACVLALSVLLVAPSRQIAAQENAVIWSEPTNISNTLTLSTHPAVVSDSLGYVHVFWSEEVGGPVGDRGDMIGTGNTILYTRWDGTSWSEPVDVLFVPNEAIAEFVAVDVGPDSRLHVVWTGQSNFYYAQAPSWEADSARAWSQPMAVAADSARTQWESDVAADSTGAVHIVYATQGDLAGIYHIRSRDGGVSWDTAQRVSEPLGLLETAYANVRTIVDDADRIHIVYQTTQAQGFGQAVYYVRSDDGGVSWSQPEQLGYRDPGDFDASYPYLLDAGNGQLHLVYLDGPNVGRSYRISHDGGETWSEPQDIISEMEGVNGFIIPLVDGAGQLHLVVNMRTRATQVVGIYYTRFLGNDWAPVRPVDTSSVAAPSAHYTAAAVRLGNELHVVYDDIGRGDIWHVQGIITAVEPDPTVVPETPMPAQTEEASRTPATDALTLTTTPRPEVGATEGSPSELPTENSSAESPVAVLAPVAAVVVLVLAAVFVMIRRRRLGP
ncbi:MAG: exo-alpha-sialidase [Chloroflexi bacterium]|nr:exo-alpha-sialidase [Chloroflexota bacterium]